MPPSPRTPWPKDCPDVVIHTDVRARDGHAHYREGKSGDANAALWVASELIADKAISTLRDVIGDHDALLLPVIADETLGFNAIPDAMAQVIGHELRFQVVAGEISRQTKSATPEPGLSSGS